MSLEILREGLCMLKEQVKKCTEDLTERLKKKESTSEADKAWLDNEANHVDEDAVIDSLENASDYKCGLTRRLLIISLVCGCLNFFNIFFSHPLPEPIRYNNPYLVGSTEGYGLRQLRL
jgi:hypothetical protein